jgi:hypothetical protein
MAKKKPRGKSAGRAKFTGETVALNPWIPAIPVKGAKGKSMLKLVLSIPLVLTAGTASGEPQPQRTLQVPVELTRHGLTLKEFDKQVLPLKAALLGKYEARIILVQKGGK